MAITLSSLPALFPVVGLVAVLGFLIKFLNLIIIYLRPSRFSIYAHKSKSGQAPWALVTGASRGIGYALVRELASNGFNVVIHGRDSEKMSRVASELGEAFPNRSFRVLIADAEEAAGKTCLNAPKQPGDSNPAPIDFDAIRHELQDLHLTVLINNAGGGPNNPVFMLLKEAPEARVTGNVSLNALFPLHLTRVLLPTLIQHAPSVVINISSLAEPGLPLLVSYGASKAFLMSATRALHLEMVMEGLENSVEILGVRFGKVTGAGGCSDPESIIIPSAETMAKATLARAGYANGIVVGYWGHALFQWISEALLLCLPRRIADNFMVMAMRRQVEYYDGVKAVKAE
ncbi:short chain dehydrogenase [Nemania abortiva]|nr:short chain dehydrogenase [Nemania abortiva]